MAPSPTLLRRALAANALFSTLCGALCLLAAPRLAPAMGLASPIALYVVGASLLPFALLVARNARREQPILMEALGVSLADLGWVLGSAVLLALPLAREFTMLGRELIIGVALCVLACALAQLLGLQRLRAGSSLPLRA